MKWRESRVARNASHVSSEARRASLTPCSHRCATIDLSASRLFQGDYAAARKGKKVNKKRVKNVKGKLAKSAKTLKRAESEAKTARKEADELKKKSVAAREKLAKESAIAVAVDAKQVELETDLRAK